MNDFIDYNLLQAIMIVIQTFILLLTVYYAYKQVKNSNENILTLNKHFQANTRLRISDNYSKLNNLIVSDKNFMESMNLDKETMYGYILLNSLEEEFLILKKAIVDIERWEIYNRILLKTMKHQFVNELWNKEKNTYNPYFKDHLELMMS